MKILISILFTFFFFISNLIIPTMGYSVETLIEGQKGKIKFQSIPVVTLNQFLKAERESQSQSSTTSSESFSEVDLASYMSKLEKYLVETAEYQKKSMVGFMSDSSCKIESKHTVKYNKEAATKVRKAVADFLIDTFEITSPL